MKEIQPKQPSLLSGYAEACLKALVKANLADRISIRGAFGLFHYIDYRPTQDMEAWWSQTITEAQKKEVIFTIQSALRSFVKLSLDHGGDVVSDELSQDNKKVFSFSNCQQVNPVGAIRLSRMVSIP